MRRTKTGWCCLTLAATLILVAACDRGPKPPPTPSPSPAAASPTTTPSTAAPAVQGWLHWRGPQQNGTSLETALPEKWELGATNDLWSVDLAGRGTPVINGDRVYVWGARGEGEGLREVLACLDAGTGKTLWEHAFSDFLSDVVYDRYAIGSPTIDPATGNVYLLTTPGLLICFTPEGKPLWEVPMMEELGRLTFPNGRTGAPVIEEDLVIINCISTNWGGQGPPRNRFYAFDKVTGEPVWASTPCAGPPLLKDSSFSSPLLGWDSAGRRVFYAGIGSGAVVCINARTGEPLWRFQMCNGGVNSSVLMLRDKIIAVHGMENLDSSKTGRMIAISRSATATPAEPGTAPLLDPKAEIWRNTDICMFTSSPVLVGERVFQVDITGELFCVNGDTGATLWRKKLGTDQIHASPLAADGKLYIPMNEGTFWILRPGEKGAEELAKVQLAGNCLGSPAVWNGRIYVQTTERLYCFGKPAQPGTLPTLAKAQAPEEGNKPATLQIIPNEVLLRPGQKHAFRIRSLDEMGRIVGPVPKASWESFIPPTARVKSTMDAAFDESGALAAGPMAKTSAGAYKATADMIWGTIRGRILPALPYQEDFESFPVTEDHATEGVKFGYPPLPWVGARFKWEVREVEGSKVLAKTTDQLILQRAISFIGSASDSNYTMTADLMSDGNRRSMGEVGLIHQRYVIEIKGNHQELEVNSNHERLRRAVPFTWKPRIWYRLKTRVAVSKDGTGLNQTKVQAKVWQRDETEPEGWTLEVSHPNGHAHGAPGLFGFSPQVNARVYVDNIKITPNG